MFIDILKNLKKGKPKKILTINTNLYESKLAGPFEIKLEDTLLRLEFKGKGAFSGQLEHWYDDTFILYFDGGDGQAYESSLITFIIENSKNVTGVDLGSFGRYNRILLNN